ncbi:MAG: hypothetical protein KDA60_08785, partial [Planctomycetales bacterium]|nr:hypothetical protein [Planctomycetales bacterium]
MFQYHGVSPTTWAYLSSLLMIGLFFKFGRFWSVRNVDVMMLIFLAPGLLLIHYGNHMQGKAAEGGSLSQSGSVDSDAGDSRTDNSAVDHGDAVPSEEAGLVESPTLIEGRKLERWGYFWLFIVGGIWLLRLLLDPAMVRRPLLTPNLSVGGLTFIGVFLFVFLMANVVTRQPAQVVESGEVQSASSINAARMDALLEYQQERGPGHALLRRLPHNAQKSVAILSQMFIVIGLVLVGYRHFDNTTNGIGAAMLYLMLPYTSQLTGRVDHVLPAALLIWAVLCYRRPMLAGFLVGTAGGAVYYPLFVLPLWFSFYWSRGFIRFGIGVGTSLALLTCGLAFPREAGGFLPDFNRMFGLHVPERVGLEGIWDQTIGGWDPAFRLSVLTAFVVLAISLAIWPARKNLGTLISCTAAVMLATQFWHGFGGGLYMAWYLPLVL